MAIKLSFDPIRNGLNYAIYNKNGNLRASTFVIGFMGLVSVAAGIVYGGNAFNAYIERPRTPQIEEKTGTPDNTQSNSDRLTEFNGALRQFKGSNSDGQNYYIVGPHTIHSNDGASDYSYNFQTRMVTIDGAGDADRAMTFAELKQDTATEAARLAGCWAATQDRKDYPALDKFSLDESLQAAKDEVIRNRDNFRETYCKGYVRD